MKLRGLAFLFFAFAASPALAGSLPGPYPADLIRVIDGDTIVARIHIPAPELTVLTGMEDVTIVGTAHVRVAGVDTPEIFRRKKGSKICEKVLGLAAKVFVENLLASGRLTVMNVRSGMHKRLDADVYADGKPLADILIAAGHGRPSFGTRSKAMWCKDTP